MTSARLSTRRRNWFRAVAVVVIPLLLLGLIEAALRLAGYGYRTSFFLRREIEGNIVLIDNQQFGKRFFPAELVRYPHPLRMPVTKATNDLRVFVLGESAAMGDPDPKFGLPRMLEILLQGRYPNRHVQVVNVSMVAINSHTVLSIARECATRQGDLWVIYMGNNEMIGPFGAISPFGAQLQPLPVIRANLWLKQFRIGQLIDRLTQVARSSKTAPREWGGMAMWGSQQVRREDNRTARVHENFRRNLRDILIAGENAGVPMILCTVATNLRDCAPFGSLHSPALASEGLFEYEKAVKQAAALEEQGDLASARSRYERARQLDSSFAETAFRLGTVCARLDLNTNAWAHLSEARDLDTLQFRADSSINRTIREAAAAHANRAALVDIEHLVASQSPQQIPGREHFYEHVHFNPDGNYLVARAVAEKAAELLAPGEQALPGGAASASWSSQSQCLEQLGFTEWNAHDILSRVLSERIEQPPFTGQLNHAQQVKKIQDTLQASKGATKPAQIQRMVRKVEQAAAARPLDADLHWNLAQLADLSDDAAKAEAEWREVIRIWPHSHLAYFNLGKLLELHGRAPEAISLYSRCLELHPQEFEARYALGTLLSKTDQHADALRQLKILVRQKPFAKKAHLALAQALDRAGEREKAKDEFREVIRIDPHDEAARQILKAP